MNDIAYAVARLLLGAALIASSYWVMFGAPHMPYVLTTVLHLYAITGIGVAALLAYKSGARLLRAVRQPPSPAP